MKLYRKIKHNKYMCRSQDLDSEAPCQGHNQVTGQNCTSAIIQKLLKQILRKVTKRLNIIKGYVAHYSKVSRPKAKVTIRSEVKCA